MKYIPYGSQFIDSIDKKTVLSSLSNDLITTGPYVKKFDIKYLEKEISLFEPKLALDGGLDGLSELKKVIFNSSKLIKRNGILVLEIAFDQAESVKRILKQNKFYINDVNKDLSRKNRCIISTRK